MRILAKTLASALFGAMFAYSAHAQTEQEFINAFAGQWQVVDSHYAAENEPCRIDLGRGPAAEGRYPLTLQGCKAELSLVTGWGISDGQMSLFDAAGTVIARLGGNQRRMSGNSGSGAPVILERSGAGGTAALLEAARRASGCIYAGFTDKCAPQDQLSKPEGDAPKVEVLVNLNIRAEARDDASIVGVVPANSCVSTELCVTATDGVWCRARFNNETGWLRKLALRQNRWPVVTFFNACKE